MRPRARALAGWTSLIGGAALLVLPGPGIPFVLAGLALLAPEQPWADRLRRRIRPGAAGADHCARAGAAGRRKRRGEQVRRDPPGDARGTPPGDRPAGAG
ncbi:MAG TPA: PGPGW domain-containing protein [Anaeromyxobacter sp.]|jgi:hypothetical protein|nr:PGPGW domain-containing protein [Anaeromyxobacter sp.]